MAVQIECSCGMTLMSVQAKPGDIITCRNCGANVVVPDGISGAAPAEPAPEPAPSRRPRNMPEDAAQTIYDASLAEQSALGLGRERTYIDFDSNWTPLQEESAKATVQQSPFPSSSDAGKPEPQEPADIQVPGEGNAPEHAVCPNCGVEIDPKASFCVACGTDIKTGKHFTTKVQRIRAGRRSKRSSFIRKVWKAFWVTVLTIIVLVIFGVVIILAGMFLMSKNGQ